MLQVLVFAVSVVESPVVFPLVTSLVTKRGRMPQQLHFLVNVLY